MRWLRGFRGRAKLPRVEEIDVARELLAGDDRRLEILLAQLATAREVERVVEDDHFSVGPAYTSGDLLFTFDLPRVESDWVPFTERESGRGLEFRVVAVRGGFLRALEGRTVDGGPWPSTWSAVPASPVAALQPILRLPSEAEVERHKAVAREGLGRWLGLADVGPIETYPPPGDAAIAARETEVGRFSPSYRTFLGITDGIESDLHRILGHRDCYLVDSAHLAALLVAWDSDDEDDFVVAISIGGEDDQVYRLDVHDREPIPRPIAADFREYLRGILAEPIEALGGPASRRPGSASR